MVLRCRLPSVMFLGRVFFCLAVRRKVPQKQNEKRMKKVFLPNTSLYFFDASHLLYNLQLDLIFPDNSFVLKRDLNIKNVELFFLPVASFTSGWC